MTIDTCPARTPSIPSSTFRGNPTFMGGKVAGWLVGTQVGGVAVFWLVGRLFSRLSGWFFQESIFLLDKASRERIDDWAT